MNNFVKGAFIFTGGIVGGFILGGGTIIKTAIKSEFFRKAMADKLAHDIKMFFYGETGRTKKNSTASKVSYRNYYEKKTDYRKGCGYDDIVLYSHREAEEVLLRMNEFITRYGSISVADLYDLVGITGKYTDNNYGWTDIKNASIVKCGCGYYIELEDPISL